MRSALRRALLLGAERRGARLLGRAARAVLQRRVAGPRDASRASCSRRCTGIPLLLGGAAGRAPSPPAAIALAARAPGDRTPTRPSAVVDHRRCSGSACCSRSRRDSPPGIAGLLFGDMLAVSPAISRSPAALAVVVARRARPAAPAPARSLGFDRARRAAALGVRPRPADAGPARACSR